MNHLQYVRKNALIYQRYKDQFNEIKLCELLTFRNEVNKAYATIPVTVEYVSGQPYANHLELSKDIKENNLMRISKDFNESILLPDILNLRFRAIHDYLHYILQAPFTAYGEIKVYNLQKELHSEGISQKILFSEVVLQACYAEYFNEFSSTQKVVLL